MAATTTDPNYLPDVLDHYPWDDERYAGCLWLCRKRDGDQSGHTLYCMITPNGQTGLYEAVGMTGHKTTVRPYDRACATLVLEDGAPEAVERLKSALAGNGWKNIIMRP
jgi:hypothetical protein